MRFDSRIRGCAVVRYSLAHSDNSSCRHWEHLALSGKRLDHPARVPSRNPPVSYERRATRCVRPGSWALRSTLKHMDRSWRLDHCVRIPGAWSRGASGRRDSGRPLASHRRKSRRDCLYRDLRMHFCHDVLATPRLHEVFPASGIERARRTHLPAVWVRSAMT